jgi:hypothetical protein
LCGGGLFYAFMMSADREGETLGERIRTWLGDEDSEIGNSS